MPIEIKELHIRLAVQGSTAGGAAGGTAAKDKKAKDALVAECVEQVLQILQNKVER